MSPPPLVSVIMPVFNAGLYVREAVESVLAQSYPRIELICINDGSRDNSVEVLKEFGGKIILIDNKENQGIGEARNNGLRIAKGEYIALMDADDLWKTEKIATQVQYLQEHPDLDLLFTYMQCFLSPDLSEEARRLRSCPPDPIPGHLAASSFMKASLFEKVGLFDARWRVGEFIDWFARAKELGVTSDILPDVFLLRRIHGTNTGIAQRPSLKDYVRIMKESLDRKRLKT